MGTVVLEVAAGAGVGRVFELDGDIFVIGRAPGCEVELGAPLISSEHARIVVAAEEVVLEDLGSTNGTALIRDGNKTVLGEPGPVRTALHSGDLIELGGEGEGSARLRVTLTEDPEPEHVVSVRPIGQLSGHTQSGERNLEVLKTLYRVQKAIGSADQLLSVLDAVADAALEVVPQATHATLVLRSDDADSSDAGYTPVTTRIRRDDGGIGSPDHNVPIARSVFRKVIRERAAVLASDAPSEAFSSESLLGASIRSTLAVPLWRGEQILGVLQVDNRARPGMFDSTDLDALGVLAANASLAVDNARLIRRLRAAEEQLTKENVFLKGRERARRVDIIGTSAALRAVLSQLDKVADTRVSVLIEGETGTGKELIASALHYRSRRAAKLFVAQNCAAMPENLLESELFGHKRGAFTGATEEKKGLFEIADGGTLFLDEVTEMPPGLQAKLLRALQEGEIRPVGATHTKHVNVRIVAASNRDLDREVSAGRFREDLYYRLKVFPLRVPPLRERRDDIPLLAMHFLERYAREMGKSVAGFSQDAMELFKSHDWPGNVRELENEVQRLVIVADAGGFITSELLSPRVRKLEGLIARVPTRGTLKETVDQVERYLLLESLREHNNNKTNAAKTLGITREGLHKKLRQLKIS
jgi:Nif-specific regulatory protein